MPEISWLHDRRRLLLPISVLPSRTADNAHECLLTTGLIDTGVTGTGIRQDIIDKLGLKKRGRRRVFTANGDIIASEHLIRIGLFPGQFQHHPFDLSQAMPYVLEEELLAHSLHPNFSFELLIGMDVISQADLSLVRSGKALLRF